MYDIYPFLGSVVPSIGNLISQILTNQSNKKINEMNLDYARSMTLQQWERDDNAHQREVRDLEAAGLSPLANTAGSQVTSAQSPQGMIAMQAPQLDVNALQNAIASGIGLDQRQQQIDEEKRHNMVLEGYKDIELSNDSLRLQNESRKLDIENKKVEENIKVQADLVKIENDKLLELSRSNKKNESLKNQELIQKEIEAESKRFYEEVRKQSGGIDIPYKEINNLDLYKHALRIYTNKLSVFISKIGATQSSYGTSKSKSANGSGGLGLTVPGSPVGGNISGSGGNSSSESRFSSENLSKQQEEMLRQWQKENPIPIYIDLEKYKYHKQKAY